MDIWSHIIDFIVIASSFIAIYLFLFTTETGFIPRIKQKLGVENYEKRLKYLLKNYKSNQHQVQNPHNRVTTVIIETFRILFTLPPLLAALGYLFYKLSLLLEINLRGSIYSDKHFVLASMITSMIAMFLIRIVLKNLSPPYHFKRFHELTVCQLYETLKKINNPKAFYAVEDIKKIVQRSLDQEFPKHELTDLGLAFFSKTYNYPKVVKKEMKKKNYNFKGDKAGLMKLLGLTFEESIIFEKFSFHYKQKINVNFQKG